jgi:hypothetical protein
MTTSSAINGAQTADSNQLENDNDRTFSTARA